ncbi:hypothetical protein CHS0354_007133 [Potamilus streckersoni]|uniref:Uncharacterized protein n=1 Tax=Potamilus streckersoni TaxID=2493646 RepID=A0AAE0VZ93_9BIVA|nr:hypothetical protein CHS0354_007133 [Potamilus streckersoni]
MAIATIGAIRILTTSGIIVAKAIACMPMTMPCVVGVARIGHSAVIPVRKLPLEYLAVLRMHVAVTALNTIGALPLIAGIIAVIQMPLVGNPVTFILFVVLVLTEIQIIT